MPALLLALLCLFLILQPVHAVLLDSADSTWIKAHPVIRVGIDPNRVPIEFIDAEGVHSGISADLLARIAKQTGLRFEVTPGLSWLQALQAAQEKKVDMLPAVRPSLSRQSYLLFTRSYMQVPVVIVVPENSGYIDGVKDLAGRSVGIVEGYASGEYLRREGRKLSLQEFRDYDSALRAMDEGKVSAVVGNLAALSYEIRIHNYSARVAAPLGEHTELAMGIRKDWPELQRILDKAIASIDEQELVALKNQWIYTRITLGPPWQRIVKIIALIIGLGLATLFLILGWNRRLQREIDERKAAQSKAAEIGHKFRMLFENMQQAFALYEIITDGQGEAVDYTLLEANPAFHALTGIDPAMAQGRRMSDYLGRGEESHLAEYGKVALGGEGTRLEHYEPQTNRWYSIWAFSPSPGHFATVATDITAQREQQLKLQAQNEDMTHFIYTVSHDLRSPLLTISNFAEELAQDLQSGDMEILLEDLRYIRNAAERMHRLLEELRLVAQAGSRKLQISEITLGELSSEVYQAIAGRYSTQKIAFTVNDRSFVLKGDRERLFQLMQNLLDNAAKYIGHPPMPRVEVGVERQGTQNAIYVRDNGLGISAENIGKVFGIFEKIDKSSEGSGIGLALAKRIVDAHQGRIWVTSPGEGQGSTFYFTLGTKPA